jgi:hypothetical protein
MDRRAGILLSNNKGRAFMDATPKWYVQKEENEEQLLFNNQ